MMKLNGHRTEERSYLWCPSHESPHSTDPVDRSSVPVDADSDSADTDSDLAGVDFVDPDSVVLSLSIKYSMGDENERSIQPNFHLNIFVPISTNQVTFYSLIMANGFLSIPQY
jgi:hypothetical protein